MNQRKLRIGIIGCGDVANFAGYFFRMNPSVALVACCDSDMNRARMFAQRHRIGWVATDYQALIAGNHLDAVYIATPHFLHYDMVKAAIRAGIAVLCEKPLTTTLEDAQSIVSLSCETGIKVGVNYQYRYDWALYGLNKLTVHGGIGRIHLVRLNVPWHREKNYLAGWRNDKYKAGGGTLLTQGSHALDFALWICGSKPQKATGLLSNRVFESPVEDLAMGIIELQNGALVQICSTMIANPERGITAEFYTSKGTIIYQSKPYPRLQSNFWLQPDFSILRLGVFAFQRSINAFVDWLLGRDDYLIPASDSIPALASVLAIYQASATGQTEMVNI